jgi:hypothetical protein
VINLKQVTREINLMPSKQTSKGVIINFLCSRQPSDIVLGEGGGVYSVIKTG